MTPERKRVLLAALRHRFVVVPLLLAVIIGLWNLHVMANDDGIISGTVRDGGGQPAADVEVVFFERDFVNFQEKLRTRTDRQGRYRFDGVQAHVGQLEARGADGARSQRLLLRLWFRAQNTEAETLTLRRPGA